MARTNNQESVTEANGVAFDASALDDSAMVLVIEGYKGFLPMRQHEALSVSENNALNEGLRQTALRMAQNVVKKAQKDGADPREALSTFLTGFDMPEKREFESVRSKRIEIGRELLAGKLVATGKPRNAEIARRLREEPKFTVEVNGTDYLPTFIAKEADAINAALGAWAMERDEVRRRGTGEAKVELDVGDLASDLESL